MFSSMERESLENSKKMNKKLEQKQQQKKYEDEIEKLKAKRDELWALMNGPLQPMMEENKIEKKLNEMKWIYSLLGYSAHIKTPTELDLELSTSYRGQYYEKYRITLQHVGRNFKVTNREEIPTYVPLSLFEDLLSSDVPKFIMTLQSHLQSIVAKRQEIMKAQDQLKPYLVADIHSIPPYSVVSFSCQVTEDDGHSGVIMFIVRYLNELSCVATSTDAVFKKDSDLSREFKKRTVNYWESIALKVPLSLAVKDFIYFLQIEQNLSQDTSTIQDTSSILETAVQPAPLKFS